MSGQLSTHCHLKVIYLKDYGNLKIEFIADRFQLNIKTTVSIYLFVFKFKMLIKNS